MLGGGCNSETVLCNNCCMEALYGAEAAAAESLSSHYLPCDCLTLRVNTGVSVNKDSQCSGGRLTFISLIKVQLQV